MREISLTRGKVALVDDVDFDCVNQFKWCALKSINTYYAIRVSPRDASGKRKFIYMHNFLLGGRSDHHDRNGLNNCRSNIRLASHGQNERAFKTKMLGASSRYRGVSWYKREQKWVAEIVLSTRKKKRLGYFDSEDEAASAYNAAALARDPDFHHLNVVPELTIETPVVS